MNLKQQPFNRQTWYRMLGNHPFATMVLLALILSPLLCNSIYGYSTWNMDEQVPVVRALGFLDFDLDPRWFGYHTLPMYLFSAMYAVIYGVYWILGLVDSKLEFASLLFSKDAVFFVSARLLCCFAYLLGSSLIARMFFIHYRSKVGCILLFLMLLFLPDAQVAMNGIRVDTFVFLFLTLSIYFSCFHQKNLASFVLSIVFCAAAIASKIPAIVFAPILFISVLWDVKRRIYPKEYLLIFPAILLLSIFCFMPYAFITYKIFLQWALKVTGSGAVPLVHFGKEHHFELAGKILNIFNLFITDLGVVGLAGAGIYCILTVVRRKQNIFPFLYVGGYSSLFLASAYVDEYWLRPVYPFLLLFAFSLIYELDISATTSGIRNKLSMNGFNIANIRSASGLLLPLLFTGIFFVHNSTVLTSFYKESTERREDTRITSANWIKNHLPSESVIYMHGGLAHYLPQLLSGSPGTTLAGTDLDFMSAVSKNRFLTDAFFFYLKNEIAHNPSPAFAIIHVGNLGIDQAKELKSSGYVVLSSYSFQRYFEEDIEHIPESLRPQILSEKRAIEFVRNQTQIAVFEGRGPRIEIYQIK